MEWNGLLKQYQRINLLKGLKWKVIYIIFEKKTNHHRMSTTSENAFGSSISPFVNEYKGITEGVVTRQENLKSEFASLSEGNIIGEYW